ncbi:MAG: hypothetical protein ACK5PT_15070, partial [Cereibacter sp.]
YVLAYQFGKFANDVRAHRNGGPVTPELLALTGLVQSRRDAVDQTVYRGLCMPDPPLPGDAFEESSLNSWSLYPSIALRLALAQGVSGFTVLRQRLASDDPALYIDEWEHEVLRSPFLARIGRVQGGMLTFLGKTISVFLIDLVK